MKNTAREEMRNLKVGDTFWINGIEHTASVAAAPCGDAEFSDEFIVYDEDDEGWLESDGSIGQRVHIKEIVRWQTRPD